MIVPHVIFQTTLDAQKEVQRIVGLIQNPLRRFIDLKVYKSNQLFRMLGSSKIGESVKEPYEGTPNKYLQDSLVQPIYLVVNLDKSNVIDIVSRLQYIDEYLYNLLETRGLHPNWFAHYMNQGSYETTGIYPTFWKQLITAAIKV